MSELVDAAALAFRFGLAFVFLTAAIPKLSASRDFERAVRNYALLPRVVVRPVARWLPRIELLCAVALLLGVAVPVIATAAAVMLTTFASGVAVNLLLPVPKLWHGQVLLPLRLHRHRRFVLPNVASWVSLSRLYRVWMLSRNPIGGLR